MCLTAVIADPQRLSFFAECLWRKPKQLWTANILFPCLFGRWSRWAGGGFGVAAKGDSRLQLVVSPGSVRG